MSLPEPAVAVAAGASAWVIVARSSITAAADRELQGLCERLREQIRGQLRETSPSLGADCADAPTGFHPPASLVRYAYTEQGEPALRRVLHELADAGVAKLNLLPLLLPMEPGTALALQRVIKRWHAQRGQGHRPEVRVSPAPALSQAIGPMLAEMAEAAAQAIASDGARVPDAEGASVPAQRHRVLVCAGGPCTDAGANLIWGHLRNIQKARHLRTEGPGVMTCKTTCLGPCALGPVWQVWPDGTWYGGVDEAGAERIVQEHLLGGVPVDELVYMPQAGKQWLRTAVPPPTASAAPEAGSP
jgi:(2Fe-2S) ferredoxin